MKHTKNKANANTSSSPSKGKGEGKGKGGGSPKGAAKGQPPVALATANWDTSTVPSKFHTQGSKLLPTWKCCFEISSLPGWFWQTK